MVGFYTSGGGGGRSASSSESEDEVARSSRESDSVDATRVSGTFLESHTLEPRKNETHAPKCAKHDSKYGSVTQ